MVIFITALINGLQSNIIKRTLSSQAHIVVRPPDHLSTPSLALAGETRFSRKVEQRTQAVSAVEQWQAVQALLHDLAATQGRAVVAVTHDPDFAATATRRIHIVDGRIVR